MEFKAGDDIKIINGYLEFNFKIESIDMNSYCDKNQVRLRRTSSPEKQFLIGAICFREYQYIVNRAEIQESK